MGPYEKHTANIILKDVFYLTLTGGPSQCNKTSRENKSHGNGKWRSKTILICILHDYTGRKS